MRRANDWFEKAYTLSPDSLGVSRVLYAVMVLIWALPIGWGLSALPPEAYNAPPGLGRWLGGLPSDSQVVLLNACILVCAAAVLVGFMTRRASLLLGVLLLLGCAMENSTGKINHKHMIVIVPFVMAMSDWGCRFSLDAARNRARGIVASERARLWSARAVALLALCVGMSFASAGLFKLKSGWLGLDTSATLGHAFANVYIAGREPLLFGSMIKAMPLWAWEAMDWATVVFELGFLLAVLWRSAFRWMLVVAVVFHIGVFGLFDIFFASTLSAYLVFVSWDQLRAGGKLAMRKPTPAKPAAAPRRWPYLAAFLLVIAVAVCAVLTGDALASLLPRPVKVILFFGIALVIAMGWSLVSLGQTWSALRR